MALGAILVVERERGTAAENVYGSGALRSNLPEDGYGEGHLACVEVLGQSVVERVVERFVRAEVDTVSVHVQADALRLMPTFRSTFSNVVVRVADDVWVAVAQKLKDYRENGIDYAFVSKASSYTEVDLVELFQFHREAKQAVTRASDGEGFLDLWIASCSDTSQAMFAAAPEGAGEEHRAADYLVREYVNRLAHPRDLRRLVTDTFRRRCKMSPLGREIKPGIWVDEGAQIHRRARIVAPAYLGCGSTIREDTLVTRSSNIESFSCIDYGTVIEDSSILTNTYVGIGLDLCHAVVQGNRLMNLAHNVALKIADPSLIRANVAV